MEAAQRSQPKPVHVQMQMQDGEGLGRGQHNVQQQQTHAAGPGQLLRPVAHGSANPNLPLYSFVQWEGGPLPTGPAGSAVPAGRSFYAACTRALRVQLSADRSGPGAGAIPPPQQQQAACTAVQGAVLRVGDVVEVQGLHGQEDGAPLVRLTALWEEVGAEGHARRLAAGVCYFRPQVGGDTVINVQPSLQSLTLTHDSAFLGPWRFGQFTYLQGFERVLSVVAQAGACSICHTQGQYRHVYRRA